MRNVTFAVTQFAASQDKGKNIDTAEKLVRESAAAGAQVILLQVQEPCFDTLCLNSLTALPVLRPAFLPRTLW